MNKITGIAVSISTAGGLIMTAAQPSQASEPVRSRAMDVAEKQIGDPYRYGAAGPDAFDCSGLLYYSYGKVGKRLPRVAQSQYNGATKISPSHRAPGDLIFIGTSSNRIYHAGIYAGFWRGYGWMLDAPKPGRTVGFHKIKYYTAGSPRAYYGRY